ncbi:hypothetical protein P4S72_01010 [Vibrio sp. PP-XX7]
MFVFATDLTQKAWEPPVTKPQSYQVDASVGDTTDTSKFDNSAKEMDEGDQKKTTRDALTGVKLVSDKKPVLAIENTASSSLREQQANSDSRIRLLAPLISRLKKQAVNGKKYNSMKSVVLSVIRGFIR